MISCCKSCENCIFCNYYIIILNNLHEYYKKSKANVRISKDLFKPYKMISYCKSCENCIFCNNYIIIVNNLHEYYNRSNIYSSCEKKLCKFAFFCNNYMWHIATKPYKLNIGITKNSRHQNLVM